MSLPGPLATGYIPTADRRFWETSEVGGDAGWHANEDLAFIHLPPHLVGNITKDCVFLDAERNFTKPEPDDCSSLIWVNSVFGLVEEFTGVTTRQDSRATTLVRGVLTSGVLRDVDALTATLECFGGNLPDLPDSFGGTSGGGLWRVYVGKRDDGSFEAVHHRLIGIASSEDIGAPPRITCQGIGWIEMMLEGVRRSMSGKSKGGRANVGDAAIYLRDRSCIAAILPELSV